MKIKSNIDDNLPLNKPLKLHLLTIIVRCIFEEDSKFFPQLYLDDCLSYVLQATYKCYNTIGLIFQKKLILTKQMHQKIVIFVTIGILKILVLSMSYIFAMLVMI